MNTPITMKVTLGALADLLSYCESKKMNLAKIKCHVDNIAFCELRGAFAHAYSLAIAADNSRTFAAMAEAIELVIAEINRAIEAAHSEALAMNEEMTAATRVLDIDEAFDQARKIDRMIGNLDWLPACVVPNGFTPADCDYIIALNRRLAPGLMACDLLTAESAAYEMDVQRNATKSCKYPDHILASHAAYFDALPEGEEALTLAEFAECLGHK